MTCPSSLQARPFWRLGLILSLNLLEAAKASLYCNPSTSIRGDLLCARTVGTGSFCHPERLACTNPFYEQGCLASIMEGAQSNRVCNSQDMNSQSNCTPPLYKQVRVDAGYTDSSLILAWIYQIVLMERLQVPVLLVHDETDVKEEWNFYHPLSHFPAPTMSEFQGTADSDQLIGEAEVSVDVVAQTWPHQEYNWIQESSFETLGTGLWGQTNLYIPEITAQRHPSLVSHYGLQQSTTEELVVIFPQPYTWSRYCQEISISNCQQPDDVAQRLPTTPTEAFAYHHESAFTGYFGAPTTDNNTADIGHVAAPSCEYTNIEAQLFWNKISLQSQGPLQPNGGYELDHMIQIWKAANATQSNVMMWWWTLDSLVEAFRDTPYAFVPLMMPGDCSEDENSRARQCSLNVQDRLGQEDAYCTGQEGEIQKAIATSLKEEKEQADNVERSPAYDFLHNLQLTDQDMQSILKEWGVARYFNDDSSNPELLGYRTRQAVCLWVAEHLEQLEAAFPSGYPRIVQSNPQEEWTNATYLTAAQAMGGIAAVVIMLTGIATVHCKQRMAVVYAQVHFVWQVLLGFWFVSMAAVLYGKEPSDSRCLLAEWLSTIGFTLVLVPLVVKVATINHIAQTMRKREQEPLPDGTTGTVVRISPMKMLLVEIGLSLCVVMYLMIWTNYDPPSRAETSILVGEDIVETTIACASKSDGWTIAVLCWQGVLLVCATVLAILTEQVVKDFKESRALGQMIYCQDLFLAMRVVLFLYRGSIPPSVYSATLSLFLSTNALLSSAIYFGPLLTRVAAGEGDECDAQNAGEGDECDAQNAGEGDECDAQNLNAFAGSHNEGTQPTGGGGPSVNGRGQPNLGMGSASSADLGSLIQNRLQQAAAHFAADAGNDPITAECSRRSNQDANDASV